LVTPQCWRAPSLLTAGLAFALVVLTGATGAATAPTQAPHQRGAAGPRQSWSTPGAQNTAYYGLGWDGSGGTSGPVAVTSFESPSSEEWDNTPCTVILGHDVCSGRAVAGTFQQLANGTSGATILASGISDKGVENWTWAPYSAPPAGTTTLGGTWMAKVALQAHVDTILPANNIGALSDVGTDILDQNAALPYLGQETKDLGVGTYVDIDPTRTALGVPRLLVGRLLVIHASVHNVEGSASTGHDGIRRGPEMLTAECP